MKSQNITPWYFSEKLKKLLDMVNEKQIKICKRNGLAHSHFRRLKKINPVDNNEYIVLALKYERLCHLHSKYQMQENIFMEQCRKSFKYKSKY
jgi:hypothetical protein